MRLYEINQAIADVIERGFSFDEETGEILFDEGDLSSLEATFNDKLESCALFVKDLEATAREMRTEERALAARRKAAESKAERLKQYILSNMKTSGTTKFETARCAVALSRSKRTKITSEDSVPDRFKETVETVKIDKMGIKKAISSGEDVPGASVEVVESLRLR